MRRFCQSVALRLWAGVALVVAFTLPHARASAAPAAAASPAPSASGAKVPLDYASYDGWNAIRGTRLSNDGAWLAYSLAPEDGDPTLVVRDFSNGTDLREDNGIDPVFTADAKFVVFAVRAKNDEIHKAEREHKKPDESPKNGAAILDLETGSVTKYGRVKTIGVAADRGNDTVAFLYEPSPSPKPGASASAAASPSTPASASPAPSASPSSSSSPSSSPTSNPNPSPVATPSAKASPDELHKRDDGSELLIDDLTHGTTLAIERVTSFAVSHDGAYVVYATTSKDGTSDGVSIYATATATTTSIAASEGHYRNLVAAPKSERFAYESDATSFAERAPTYALYSFDAATLKAGDRPVRVADAATAGLGRGLVPSADATPSFSRDGARLFFGAAPAPTPVPSGTPEPLKVDIWSWRDPVLQSQQRKDAERDRKRTYLAVADLATQRVAQLGAPDLRDVIVDQNPTTALGLDDRAYRTATSWTGEDAADIYAISLATGARTPLARDIPYAAPGGGFARADALSPGGGYVVYYEPKTRAWNAVRVRDRRRIDLTSKLRVAFYDELDDHPAPPAPYGIGGWLDGERALLVLDRYDLWAIDPQNGNARNLTGGYGRAHHLRFTPVRLDPEATSFDSTRPIVLAAHDDLDKDGGYYVLDPGARAPRRIVLAPKAFTGLLKARDASRFVTFAQRFDEARNLWSFATLEGTPSLERVSDANPQMARYRWGHAHLISYRTTWGRSMQGVVIVPDGAERAKRSLPMLVYFYERFTDDIHALPFTTPAPNTSPTLVRYVSHGYVVFLPDVAYRTGHPGASALGSVLPGVDAVLREGLVDPKRIGIAGHSWAAYQIAYMITQTDRFRAAEAGAAVTDMASAYGGIRLESGIVREAQYETGQSRIGATPWDRPDLYLENSALFHIRNVHTPYLTIANDLDGAVPFSQGIEWITAMRRLGKEAYLFSFDGEDHNLVGREPQKYWTVHLDEFFDHFLQGAPEPTWMTHGVDFLHRGERPVRPLFGETP